LSSPEGKLVRIHYKVTNKITWRLSLLPLPLWHLWSLNNINLCR
jgi:hypothetical protein